MVAYGILAFGVSGFGGAQTAAAPQIFQALSLGGRTPVPPAPPYGTPNQNLVPVSNGKTFSPNLTLAAGPAFSALAQLQAQSALSLTHPPLLPRPFATTAVAAINPAITLQQQGAAPAGIPGQQNLPEGPVSFIVPSTAGITKSASTLSSSLAALRAAFLNPPATLAIKTIAKTVSSIAVAAVYPHPVFSLHA